MGPPIFLPHGHAVLREIRGHSKYCSACILTAVAESVTAYIHGLLKLQREINLPSLSDRPTEISEANSDLSPYINQLQ